MNTLDFVTFYASEKHWRIFPLKPHDKRPLFPAAHEINNPCRGECGQVGHGLHDATDDIFKLAEWWSKYPDANVGIATGKQSGFFALDIDAGHGGMETLKELTSKNGELPPTPIGRTGGGGAHYLFSYPATNDIRNTASKIGKGIDSRGEGGYIAAPPSLHPCGKPYVWDRDYAPSKVDISEAPDWLVFMLAEQKLQPEIMTPSEGVYLSGQRNSNLTSLAGSLRRRGLNEDEIFVTLNKVNLNKCIPPLHEDEVRAIALSVIRYPAQAAPKMDDRDRISAEWSFAKCIFEIPGDAPSYQYLKPEFFGSESLRKFWIEILAGKDSVHAAASAGVLADLESYNDYLVPRLDGYAQAIKHYGYISCIKTFGLQLQSAADGGDYSKIGKIVTEINRGAIMADTRGLHISSAWDDFEAEVNERSANPQSVWGIHYYHAPYLSLLTGGKQPGELILAAGEPKVGKSWWWLLDALETAMHDIPTLYWCREMRHKQIIRRMAALLGLDSRRSKTGNMRDEDWQILREAKALLYNIPLIIDDQPLQLHELRPMLKQKQDQYGIQEFVLDYGKKISAPGKNEIEQTENISNEVKEICTSLNMAGILIVSVTKAGMDAFTDNAVKSNVRGSGQQLHDADVIYTLTKYNPKRDDSNLLIKPNEYEKAITLHINDGRELDHRLPGGMIDYVRIGDTPKFEERKEMTKDSIPEWLQRKDIT